MSRLIAILCLLFAPLGRADEAAVFLDSAKGLTRTQQLQLLAAGRAALRELSGLQVKELPPPAAESPRQSCGKDATCLQGLAASARVAYALVLGAAASGNALIVEAALVGPHGEILRGKSASGDASAPEVAVAETCKSLVPVWLRKGFGGLEVEAPAGAVVKIDGRPIGRAPLAQIQTATAGAHEVDALFADGSATLERVKVPEGGKLRLSLSPAPVGGGAERSDALLYASYGTFTAGALAIAGSFVAASLANNVARDARGCVGPDRSCLSFRDAQVLEAKAGRYSKSANLLLGTGALLSLTGVGLFVFDSADSGEAP